MDQIVPPLARKYKLSDRLSHPQKPETRMHLKGYNSALNKAQDRVRNVVAQVRY